MSVVIIGGNECMVCQYEKICKQHGCKAKVFVKEKSSFGKKIGNPDLMILFTNTVSHKWYIVLLQKQRARTFRLCVHIQAVLHHLMQFFRNMYQTERLVNCN